MGCCLSKETDNVLLQKIQQIINDPNMLQKPIDAAFNFFDKDKSGFIEKNEVIAVAEQVCRKLGLPQAPTPAVNMIFDKVAGSDGKLNKAEFTEMLKRMFHLAQEQKKEKASGLTSTPNVVTAA